MSSMSWISAKYFWIFLLFSSSMGTQTDDICITNDGCHGGKKLVIVDTDTAVDDAMGLVMMLSNPEWKVIAITTVFGNVDVELASTNVMRTLNTLKRKDIPIYKGAASPLIAADFGTDYHGADGLGDKGTHYPVGDLSVESQEAANALVRLVRAHPGQITILTLGPLTNLAMAQRLDPNFLKNVKQLHIMGGNVDGTSNLDRGNMLAAEYNFAHDPEAVQIVISESTVMPELYTWEVCQKSATSWDVYDEMVRGDSVASRFLRDITTKSTDFERNVLHVPTMGSCCCDFFTAIVTVNPKVVKQAVPRYAVMELNGMYTRGMLVVHKNPYYRTTLTPNVNIITQLDTEEVKKTIMKMVTHNLEMI